MDKLSEISEAIKTRQAVIEEKLEKIKALNLEIDPIQKEVDKLLLSYIKLKEETGIPVPLDAMSREFWQYIIDEPLELQTYEGYKLFSKLKQKAFGKYNLNSYLDVNTCDYFPVLLPKVSLNRNHLETELKKFSKL